MEQQACIVSITVIAIAIITIITSLVMSCF